MASNKMHLKENKASYSNNIKSGKYIQVQW